MTASIKIVGLGEILWDIFSESDCFGGAPANFACSAAGITGGAGSAIAVDVMMVSAIGRDELGLRAIEELQRRNVSVRYVQRSNYPTGKVTVHIDDAGQADYTFLSDTAWDNLEWSEDLRQLAQTTDAVCFGTLGQRSSVSRETIKKFVAATPGECLRILDINLRSPHWTDIVLRESLPMANVVKMNSDELPVVAALLSLTGDESEQLQQLRKMFALQLVVVTRGAEGSILLDIDGQISQTPGQSVQVADTVGAGDAFTAALTVGFLMKKTMPLVHLWAERVAAFVCTQRGGTPTFPPNLRLPHTS